MVLDPCVAPKFDPLITTEVPAGPETGVRLDIDGPREKETPLLEIPPTDTCTRPVVAPDGTGTVILVLLQAEGDARTPLKVTVLDPWGAPKPEPEIGTEVPATPDVGLRLVMPGPTVKL